jgi:hypothetical protein
VTLDPRRPSLRRRVWSADLLSMVPSPSSRPVDTASGDIRGKTHGRLKAVAPESAQAHFVLNELASWMSLGRSPLPRATPYTLLCPRDGASGLSAVGGSASESGKKGQSTQLPFVAGSA